MDYKQKYLKYFNKYKNLVQNGSGFPPYGGEPSSPQNLIDFWTLPRFETKRQEFIQYLMDETLKPQKSGHYIWWIYPNIQELTPRGIKTELQTIEQYLNLLSSEAYKFVRQIIDVKSDSWFDPLDYGRVKAFRSNSLLYPLPDELTTKFSSLSMKNPDYDLETAIKLSKQLSEKKDSEFNIGYRAPRASGPIFNSIDVTADGSCFFYSLYQALKYHNLLENFLRSILPEVRINNKREFNISLRNLLSRNLLIYDQLMPQPFRQVYNSYINSNTETGARTYQTYSQTAEQLGEDIRILPQKLRRGQRPINQEQFKQYISRKIKDRSIFPNDMVLSLLKEIIFNLSGININFNPNIIELLSNNKPIDDSVDITKRFDVEKVQFIRPIDYKKDTVYLHRLRYQAHYHWIKTEPIISTAATSGAPAPNMLFGQMFGKPQLEDEQIRKAIQDSIQSERERIAASTLSNPKSEYFPGSELDDIF